MSAPILGNRFAHFLTETLAADPTVRDAFEDAHARSQVVEALVRLRRRLGLTQSQVATSMGVKQPTVSGFETEGSDPRLSTLQRYARSVDAVLVWSIQPRNADGRSHVGYVELAQELSTSANTEQPSRRALAWTTRKPYREQARAA